LLNNEDVFIQDLEQLPQEAKLLRQALDNREIESSLSVPLEASGSVVGALTFTSVNRGVEWPWPPVFQSRMLRQVFACAILRKRVDQALTRSEKRSQQAVRDLGGKLIRAQEEERSRIARELHDDISQRLALLTIDLRRLQGIGGKVLEAEVSSLCRKVDELAGDIHSLSHRLHSTKLDHLGLVAALRSLCHEFSKQSPINIEFRCVELPTGLDREISLSLFRVAQEALTNVVKHSDASNGWVDLECSGSHLRLRISDNGVGFESGLIGSKEGLGLLSMRERMQFLGGRLTISSQPSAGAQVEACLPLRKGSPSEESAVRSAA